ncbi:MAG: hypothetical protein HQ567_05460, partial [Candidatus Nealsonbacteria bacterium]|nr:hypothetical protein [Candidatus Nealsonbacteria bacterium]
MSRIILTLAFLATALLLAAGGTAQADIVAPTDVAGTVLWLDATDAATITLDGGEVSQWNDKSAVGTNHFSYATAGQRPVVSSAAQNGLDVLTFDGLDDRLAGPAVLTAGDDDYTYFAVWQPYKNSGVQRVFEQYELNVASRYGAMLAINDRYGFNGQNNDRHDLIPFGANQWRLTDMEIDNSLYNNVNVYDNGARFEGRTGNPAALDIGTTASTIGAKNGGANAEFLQGDLAELIVYDRALDYEEHNEVGKYLSDKYDLGITFPLPEPPPEPEPGMVHQWTFNNGNPFDSVGDAHGTLYGDVEIVDGQLNLNKDGLAITGGDRMVTGALGQPLIAKTLVAWCSLNDLADSSGGPLSVQQGGTFDSICYGERQPGTWFAGSSSWQRSQDPPQGGDPETKIDEEIMLAIAYNADNSIDVYRDGVLYSSYTKGTLIAYAPAAVALIGPRADTGGFHNGTVNESRIYNYALDADEIAALYT